MLFYLPLKIIVKTISPRVYSAVFEDRENLIEDRSLLTRKAMVEQGLPLFS